MMNGIRAKFTATVCGDADLCSTREGKPWAAFPVAVHTQKDAEAGTSFVRIAYFGDRVQEMFPKLVRGAEIYCEGRLALRSWKAPDGKSRHGFNLATSNVRIMAEVK